jgi:RNA polymerase sigma-70 factor (ECF subfamily)
MIAGAERLVDAGAHRDEQQQTAQARKPGPDARRMNGHTGMSPQPRGRYSIPCRPSAPGVLSPLMVASDDQPLTARASPPQVVAATAANDHSEEALARQFWERIRLFATRRLSDATAAEDVAQETLRRVMEALRAGRVRQMETLPAFVFQTALHICQQHHRSAGREERALGKLSAVDAPLPPDALSQLISRERRGEVHRALMRLRPEDRDLLQQMYYQDLEPDEIAQRLGLSAGALRVRKHRALQRLAELVGRGGKDG